MFGRAAEGRAARDPPLSGARARLEFLRRAFGGGTCLHLTAALPHPFPAAARPLEPTPDRAAVRWSAPEGGTAGKEDAPFPLTDIITHSIVFRSLLDQIDRVALRTTSPILLTGPTGSGKSLIARRIYELKRGAGLLSGPFVPVNSATLRGDAVLSALFGHARGAFTGAVRDRPGLLLEAHRGLLFLDEIGALDEDVQAMLLVALEEKSFFPLGSEREVRSDFHFAAGTLEDLEAAVREGRFREDLLARIGVWTFRLPGLRERPEDIGPNLRAQLEACSASTGLRVSLRPEAERRFLGFATSPEAAWRRGFRDLAAAAHRMATLAPDGDIGLSVVEEEIRRLLETWAMEGTPIGAAALDTILGRERTADIDRFVLVQLADVVEVCRSCSSLSEAGRVLFACSRRRKSRRNDADRLRKYLARFGLDWETVRRPIGPCHGLVS